MKRNMGFVRQLYHNKACRLYESLRYKIFMPWCYCTGVMLSIGVVFYLNVQSEGRTLGYAPSLCMTLIVLQNLYFSYSERATQSQASLLLAHASMLLSIMIGALAGISLNGCLSVGQSREVPCLVLLLIVCIVGLNVLRYILLLYTLDTVFELPKGVLQEYKITPMFNADFAFVMHTERLLLSEKYVLVRLNVAPWLSVEDYSAGSRTNEAFRMTIASDLEIIGLREYLLTHCRMGIREARDVCLRDYDISAYAICTGRHNCMHIGYILVCKSRAQEDEVDHFNYILATISGEEHRFIDEGYIVRSPDALMDLKCLNASPLEVDCPYTIFQ